MIAIDTNVLARSILNDDEVQSKLAKEKIRSFLEKGGVFVPSVCVLELVWIMNVKKKTKENIIKTLEYLLQTDGFYLGNDGCVRKAVALYKSGKADFGDYLIYSEAIEANAELLSTFDKKFAESFAGKFVKQIN